MTALPVAQRANEASSSSTARRFSLSGPSRPIDDRVHAYRRDLVDLALAGQLVAPHYARPMIRGCGLAPSLVRLQPTDTAEAVTELLPGEEFSVLDVSGDWAWGYCRFDHRVGYVEVGRLSDPLPPTHLVAAANAPLLEAEGPRSAPLSFLPMGSRLRGDEQGEVLRIYGGVVPLKFLRPFGEHDKDPVAVAQRLLGAPYLRGGRTERGIDCSGLVQLAHLLCGKPFPRDTEHQRTLGHRVEDDSDLKRGDLVFWDQHVALVVDDVAVIHVSLATRQVAIEPLRCLGSEGGMGPLERRRLQPAG